MAIFGHYIPFSSKQLIVGIGIVFLIVGLSLPLYLLNFQTNTTTNAQIAQSEGNFGIEEAIEGPSLTLLPGVSILVDPDEPASIQKAVLDLQRDLEKVLGTKSEIVSTVNDLSSGSVIVVTFDGQSTAQFRDSSLIGDEAHQFSVEEINDREYVVLQGSDALGTVFAVYTFSDKIVGVPPLWFWSSWEPEQKTELVIGEDAGRRISSPQVEFRTFFPNNQDLFLSWNPTVDRHEILFETMLRLKFNSYYVGPDIGQFSESVYATKTKPASDRGLVIVTNALSTFGSWDRYWKEKRGLTTPHELSLANSLLFEDYWKFSLQYAKDRDLDVLWLLGFRGRNDGGFEDSTITSDSQRGSIIESQTQRQIDLVKSVLEGSNPQMAFLVWNELTSLMDSGNLDLPNDSDVIWLFGNDVRDHFPSKSSLSYPLPSNQPFGFYMNLQFYSTGAHLAQAEGPWKIKDNLTRITARKPGERIGMVMFNVGNIREYLIETSIGSEMLWDISAYNVDDSLKSFFSRYISSSLSSSLVTVYKDFLNSYWKQRPSDIANFDRQYIFQDLRIKEAVRIQLQQIRSKKRNLNPFNTDRLRIDIEFNKAASQVGSVMLGSQKAYKDLETVLDRQRSYESQISERNLNFYFDTFSVPSEFLYHAYKTLYLVTRSHFKVESSISESVCYLKDARAEAILLQQSFEKAKHGEFASWYQGEDLFGVQSVLNDIDATLRTLPNLSCSTPSTVVNSPTPINVVTPTPTRTPTPTQIQGSYPTQSAYASVDGLKQSNVKDGKRTVFRAMRTMKLKQLSCYGCSVGSGIKLWHSSSSFSFGEQLYSGSISSTESSWGSVDTDIQLIGGHYYIFEFTPVETPVYYGSTIQQHQYFQFVRYATVGASNWKSGSWQVRFSYQR